MQSQVFANSARAGVDDGGVFWLAQASGKIPFTVERDEEDVVLVPVEHAGGRRGREDHAAYMDATG